MPAPREPLVLVVDHEAVARTLAWVLEASGYVAAIAYGGKDAVQMATKVGANVAVVDIQIHSARCLL